MKGVVLAVMLLHLVAGPSGGRDVPPIARDPARVVRVATIAEANHFLMSTRHGVSPAEFSRWCGVAPRSDRFGDRWRLADGVLLTNCMQSNDGTLAISCWGRSK
jgi:hypothetical protein